MSDETLQNVGLRLPRAVVAQLDELCEKTYRNRQDVLRAVVTMLFANGVDGANRILSLGLLEMSALQDHLAALQAAAGEPPNKPDRKPKAGR